MNTNSLTDFTWDNNPEQAETFFDFSLEAEEPKAKEEEKEKEDKSSTEEPAKEVKEEPKDPREVFSEFTDEEIIEPTDKKDGANPNKGTQSKNTVLDKFNMFKDEGIFKHVDLEEEEEDDLDENRFNELLNEEYESEVSARLETWANEELDDDAKAFIAFKQKGGKTQDFLNRIKDFNVLDGDISDETFQKNVIREQLEAEDWDDEEIKDRLETLEESGRLSTTAEKYYTRMKNKAQKEKDSLIKNQERVRENQERSKREFKDNLRTTLNSIKEVKGIKINTREKNTLFNFITNEDQVIGTRKVTGFQKAIAEAVQDENKIILLAKMLNSDFDLSDLEKQIKNKEVNKLKENLESRKDLRPRNSSSTGSQGKSLGEIFSQY